MTLPQCATCYAMMAAIEALHPLWQEQKETGGEHYAPLEIWCMAATCRYPGKMCLFVEKGGKRPQDAARKYECRDYMAAFA